MTDMTPILPPLPTLPHWCEHGTPFARAMHAYATAYGEQCARQAVQDYIATAGVAEGMILVERRLLQDAESSLGSFCSDEGWGDADMQAMDNLSAALSAAPPAVEARVPPDATPQEWQDAVWKVWKLARTHNNTIPSHWLDAMRDAAIFAAPAAPGPQGVPEPADMLKAWHEAVTQEADNFDMDREAIESIFARLLPPFMADKYAAGFVTLPLDSLIEDDDYGVFGSTFYRCKVCGSESGAGALNDGIKHESDCPLADHPQPPSAQGEQAQQASAQPTQAADPIRALIAKHSELLESNEYAYFELAYTRQTGWMAWLTDKPFSGPVVNPDRVILASGQGETPDEACYRASKTGEPS